MRVAADSFLDEFDTLKEVRDVMLRFTQAYIAQLSQNVATDFTPSNNDWLAGCWSAATGSKRMT